MTNNERQKKLNEFGRKVNTANWYIGISAYQEKNIFELSGSLRDDYEQGSSFRVFKFLQTFGLTPLLSNKKILAMVQMSRGNDLAFLYFLLEGVYKTPREDGEFSNNEKLLMIAIAKLDLLPTLRELDRILPPPQYGKFEVQHKERQTEIELKELSLRLKNMKNYQPIEEKKFTKKKTYILPYFERLVRPKRVPSKLTSRPQDMVVAFPFWKHKERPDYGRQTEAPWFTQYELNPISRLIRNLVSDVVDQFLDVDELLGKAVKEGPGMIDFKENVDGEPSLCLYHKSIEDNTQLLKDELTVKARDRCLEMYNINMGRERDTKRRKARIIAQLEHDIKDCMERNAASLKTDLQKVHTISQRDCVIKATHVPIPRHSIDQQREGRALVGSCTNLAHTVVTQKNEKGQQIVDTFFDKIDFKDLHPELSCHIKPPVLQDFSTLSKTVVEAPAKKPANVKGKGKGKGKTKGKGKGKGKGKRKKGGANNENHCDNESTSLTRRLCPQSVSIVDQPCGGQNCRAILIAGGKLKPNDPATEPKCNVILVKNQTRKSFFRAASSQGPYKFKYHRIFQTAPKPYDLKKHIAQTFVKALVRPPSQDKGNYLLQQQSSTRIRVPEVTSQDTDYLDKPSDSSETTDASSEHSGESHIDYKANVVDAVVKCVKQIWQHKEAVKRLEMEKAKKHSEPTQLKYEITHFDPDDDNLMDRLLFDGMKELQKDQRYVLATLPESHKLPALREWIKRRFGKSYTQKELYEQLEESQRVFEVVQTMQSSPPKPDLMGLDQISAEKSNFANFKAIQALGAKVKIAYCEKLNQIYMEQMNACWSAMGNYRNPGGPPRKIFYAYMSSNPRDIIRQHVWNGEFRNYKQIRDLSTQNVES